MWSHQGTDWHREQPLQAPCMALGIHAPRVPSPSKQSRWITWMSTPHPFVHPCMCVCVLEVKAFDPTPPSVCPTQCVFGLDTKAPMHRQDPGCPHHHWKAYPIKVTIIAG